MKIFDLRNFVEISGSEFTVLSVPMDHQELMDVVYGIWNYSDYAGKKDRLTIAEKCGSKFKAAVQLGNFNYQVGNGGMSQWVYNHYAVEDILDIIEIISSYIKTIKDDSNYDLEVSNNIIKALNEIVKYSNPDRDSWLMDCSYCDGTGECEDEDDDDEEGKGFSYGTTPCWHCGGSGTETTKSYSSSLEEFNYDVIEKKYLFQENKDNLEDFEGDYFKWGTMFQRILNTIENEVS